jgi:nicotinamidase-related amidase
VGLCTDICVISNALILRAAYPNAAIMVIADACAGTTPEAHKMALEIMRHNHIIVLEDAKA